VRAQVARAKKKKKKTRAPPRTARARKRTSRSSSSGAAAAAPLRRSKRSRGAVVDYTIERVEESAPDPSPSELRASRVHKKKLETAEVLANSAKWLAEHKLQLANAAQIKMSAPSSSSSSASSSSSSPWQDLARERWGAKVDDAAGRVQDWESYVLTRTSTPGPISPLSLLQEKYMDCPWKLLIACVLMSRVSSAAVKERALSQFFAAFPTPSAALDSRPAEVFEILKPLGLFPNRHKAVISISSRFLFMGDNFDVGLQKELKIYGVGAFGVDSFMLFCRDAGRLPGGYSSEDRNLQAYCRFCKQHASASRAAATNTERKQFNN
jgi:methyl-CpG-binding domain protein 4